MLHRNTIKRNILRDNSNNIISMKDYSSIFSKGNKMFTKFVQRSVVKKKDRKILIQKSIQLIL